MKLNDAIIENKVLNKVEYNNLSEFIKDLIKSDTIVADIYLNFKKVATSRVLFSESSDWLIANLNGTFSLLDTVFVNYINIKLHEINSDIILISSSSKVCTFIENNDQEFHLNFKVTSLVPYNERKFNQPQSFIKCLKVNTLNKSKLDCLKGINDDIELEIEVE